MTKAIKPEHIYDLVNISGPSISPDGMSLAFVRSRIDDERTEDRSQVMMMRLPDGDPQPFTQGDHDAAPRFSPDGGHIAFLRPDEDGTKQVWTIPVSGGEARKITDLAGGAAEHAWSPDSRRLALVSDVDPDAPDDSSEVPQVRVARRVRYRHDKDGWRGDAFRHVFVVDVESGEARQTTSSEGDDHSPVWSPDGTRIAFISDRREDRDFTWHSEAYVVPSDGGAPELWSDGLYSVGSITWSPEGSRLAVTGSDDVEVSDQRQGWLFVVGVGQEPMRLTDGSVTPVSSPSGPPATGIRWVSDGRIMFVGDSRGQSYLCEVPAAGGGLRRIAGGRMTFTADTLDSPSPNVVVLAGTPDYPGDLHLIDIETGRQHRLTASNEGFLDGHPSATQEKFTLRRAGEEIESRVLMPPDFEPSHTYPMVVDVHGGPHGRFSDSFDITQQVLATSGYVVLAVNPRGSSSYSPDFLKAVVRDWGGEDYLDIMAAVDEMCSRPYVDETRVGIHGYSYGGFMGSWAVGHTNRFGAAVVGAPCTNLSSMYGTSDIGVSFGEVHWGGMRKDALDLFLEHSPLTYASNVETPVLLLHGEDDLRCPIEQSEQYFVALKRLGKEVEFVRFPGSPHGFRRSGHPRLRAEYLTRMVGWFDRCLR